MQLSEIRAIVTGGVSGLGLAVAEHLVANGGRVALFDVNDDKGAAAVDALGQDNARYIRTDVTDEDGVNASVEAAKEFLGGIDAAVNCAGVIGAGRVLGREGPMPLGKFSSTVMVNLVGSFNVAKAAAAVMQHNQAGEDGERGVIINTASVAAYEGQVGQIAYAASKGGVYSMGICAARDLAQFGIRVNTIAPGTIETPMLKGLTEEFQKSLEAAIPFPSRLGRPSDYAQLANAIVEQDYLNGESFRMDGALRMAPR